MELKQVILQLYEIGAIKFGDFTLKSGMKSPFYIDLRETISYPSLLKSIADLMWEQVKESDFERVCGVPYTAIPIASYLSIKHQLPMLMRRKEIKEYGTKKIIEGSYSTGDRCLVIEDLVTSGASVLETIAPLEVLGVKVSDVVVFLDREQGGRETLKNNGYTLHAVVTISSLFKILAQEGITYESVCVK